MDSNLYICVNKSVGIYIYTDDSFSIELLTPSWKIVYVFVWTKVCGCYKNIIASFPIEKLILLFPWTTVYEAGWITLSTMMHELVWECWHQDHCCVPSICVQVYVCYPPIYIFYIHTLISLFNTILTENRYKHK